LFSELAEIGKDKMRGWVKGLIIAGVAVGAALAILGAYYAKISSN
jgi:VIT1/CCC1 family predicted Fe2+/Mn2+ transporter